MNIPDECPVCGDPVDSKNSLVGHVNAKADHPPWSEVKADLAGGDDQATEGAEAGNEGGESPGSASGEGAAQGDDQATEGAKAGDEGGKSPDTDADDDQGEAGNDQATDQANAPDEGGEEADVATPDEYDHQHDQGDDQGESGDDDQSDDQGPAGNDQGEKRGNSPLSAWAAVPIGPRTTLTIVAVAAVLWLLYRAASADGTDTEPVDTEATEADGTDAWNDADTSGDSGLVADVDA